MQKNQEMVGASTSHPHLGRESRKTAGIILVVFPTVIYGGISLVTFLIDHSAGYVDNPARQNLFRAGHAHAGQDSSFRFCLLAATGAESADLFVVCGGACTRGLAHLLLAPACCEREPANVLLDITGQGRRNDESYEKGIKIWAEKVECECKDDLHTPASGTLYQERAGHRTNSCHQASFP